MTTKSTKKLLYEVSIIRPTIIFLLVVLHSFTKIAAGGGKTNDYQLANAVDWFGRYFQCFIVVDQANA